MSNTLIDTLAKQVATGQIGRAVKLPSIATPNSDNDALLAAVKSIKTILDTREGNTGSVLDKNLTMRDLLDAGALSIKIGDTTIGDIVGDGGLTFPGVTDPGSTPGYTDPRPTLDVPPTPDSLAAAGTLRAVILTWNIIDYANASHIEVWRATSDSLGSAAHIGDSKSLQYVDAGVAPSILYYYWVRAVGFNSSNEPITGAFNSVHGTSGGAQLIGDVDVGDLIIEAGALADGSVTGSKLADKTIGATKLGDGAVTARTLVVTDFQNLCSNGNGDHGVEGWDISQVIQPTGYNPGANEATATGATFWAGVGVNSVSAIAFEQRDSFFGPYFDVAPGDEFRASMNTMPFGGGGSNLSFSLGLVVFDANYGVIDYRPIATRPAGAVSQMYIDATAKMAYTNVAKARVWVQIGGSNPITGNGNAHYATNIRVLRRNAGQLIVDGAITANHLAANSIAVGTAAIQNAAIVNAMIGNLAVDDAKIASLNAAKIVAGTITADKIAGSTITGDKIAANTITAGNLAANTITAGQIAARSLTAVLIAAGAITANEIQAGTITADKMNVTSLAAISANLGTVTAGNLSSAVTFAGVLTAATGTFSGALSAASGTFAGSLSAASGTFAGSLTSAALTVAGNAIFSPAYASSGSTVTLSSGAWTDLLTTSAVNPGPSGSVSIVATVEDTPAQTLSGGDTSTSEDFPNSYRIVRVSNGLVIAQWSGHAYTVVDVPGGSSGYKLQGLGGPGATSNGRTNYRTMTTLGVTR